MEYIIAVSAIIIAAAGCALVPFYRICGGRQSYYSWYDENYEYHMS